MKLACFMKVFIISIEEQNSPRLNKFLSQPFFEQGNLKYTKLGVKGGELSAKQYFEDAVKGRSSPLTPGELGCTLSHLNALENFLKTDEEYILILEDDAILPVDLSLEILEEELKKIKLPKNTLFSLGGIQMKECHKVRGKYCNFSLFGKKVLEVVPDFYHRVNYTVSYIVDRKMAKTLLEYHKPIRRTDDWSYLYDFDQTSHIYMTYLVDHPIIDKGEKNQTLSLIEHERIELLGLSKSKYGRWIGKNLSKIKTHKY